MRRILPWILLFSAFLSPEVAFGQEALLGVIEETAVAGPEADVSASVRLIMLLTALAVLPALMLLMTPFTRFVIVFSLLRQALGLQQSPPNQVLIGLSVALSLVVMHPTLQEVNDTALQPYMAGEVETMDALETAMVPMRRFMLAHTQRDDLGMTMRMARLPRPETLDDIPSSVVVTSFVLSELRAAFAIAVRVYIPFLVVDLVIASILLGMGMMMLPPVVISLPFKLLVFVLMDGWSLIVVGLVGAYV